MTNEKLIIGMPGGSLADPNRGGNLIELLSHSGFFPQGYQAGGPTAFENASFLLGWDGRPQEFGSQLAIGELDVAIAGDDWVRERQLEMSLEYKQELPLKKVLGLNRGRVRIVGIVTEESGFADPVSFLQGLSPDKKRLTLASELPYLALDWITRRLKEAGLGGRFPAWSVQRYKTPPRIDSGIVIYETWGKTEAKVRRGGADLGVEITQSGSALKNYGLRIIDQVMESESGIWVRSGEALSEEKQELLSLFLLNLKGSLSAENKVLLVFNLPREKRGDVESYLRQNKLFADEPTRSSGETYEEYSIQVNRDRADLPLPLIRWELARRGARNIDTIPLLSSIPGLPL
ncbi:MAG: hypothetical protein LBQ61_10430 [Spirochaetales bacterium]|jgi:ATP phosphoribosyltransferase|nr:hypothetical protein [Spirochaetales bacterium]